jgi:hypothetical protein
VQVTGSGVHDYFRTRSHAKEAENSPTKPDQSPVSDPTTAVTVAAKLSSEGVQRKITALKAATKETEPSPRRFEYNPDEPLRLKR